MCLVYCPLMGSSDSLAARRAARKQAHLTTARECGGRFARACEHEVDPAVFLEQLPASGLTPAERRAKAGLLPATWRAAFGQGWRNALAGRGMGRLGPTGSPSDWRTDR